MRQGISTEAIARRRAESAVYYREVEGMKFKAIGLRIGVSEDRARTLYGKGLRHRRELGAAIQQAKIVVKV